MTQYQNKESDLDFRAQFGDYFNESNRLEVILDKDHLQINDLIKQRQLHLISWDDVVGSNYLETDQQNPMNDTLSHPEKSYFCVYAYPKKTEPLGVRTRLCRTFIVDHSNVAEENRKIARLWHHKIQHILRQRRAQKGLIPHANLFDRIDTIDEAQCSLSFVKPFLIFINPKSGKGCSQRQFSDVVGPILNEAGLPYELMITKCANHAKKHMLSVDWQRFSAFVVLSGDGLIYEVINGLALRPDWEEAIKIPIGALPGGSGNGLSSTLCYEAGENLLNDLLISSTFLLTQSCIRPIDLVHLESMGQNFLSFLSFGYGMMAQVDIESENLRWMGNTRFAIVCLIKALAPTMKTYRVRLSFLPVENEKHEKIRYLMNYCGDERSRITQENQEESSKKNKSTPPDNVRCEGDNLNWKNEESAAHENGSDVITTQVDSSRSNWQHPSPYCELVSNYSVDELSTRSDEIPSVRKLCKHLVPLSKDVPSNWITLEDDFINIYASYVSHLAVDNHFAPGALLDDGYIHLSFITKGFSRLNILNMLAQVSQGKHVENPDIYVIRVHAFRLEPLDLPKDRSLMTVDGESIPSTLIQAEVIPSLGRVLACSSPKNASL